jgi:hypothetical protein
MGVVVAGSVAGTRSDVLIVCGAVCSRWYKHRSTLFAPHALLCALQKIPRMAAPPPRLMWKYPEHYKVRQT